MKLGVIGTGVITGAIVRGLLMTDFPVENIIVSARSREGSFRLREMLAGIRVCGVMREIMERAEMLSLAIRPPQTRDVLQPLTFRPVRQVVSLGATVSIDRLKGWTHR